MAMVTTAAWVPPVHLLSAAPAFGTSVTIDSTTDRVALVFKAPRTGSIDRVAFRTRTVTSAATITARLETVNLADAYPSGTLWATNTSGTQTSPATNTVYEAPLTAAASVTAGDVLALVLQCDSGTPNLQIATLDTPGTLTGNFPYGVANTTGSYAQNSYRPMAAVRYGASPGYVNIDPQVFVCQDFVSQAINTGTGGTTGTRRGLRFTLPYGAELSGCWIFGDFDGDADLVLYSDAGAVVATLSGLADQTPTERLDADQRGATSARGHFLRFAPQTLTANTYYRLAVVPEGATSITLYDMTGNDAVGIGLTSVPLGADFHATYYDGANWQNTTTSRPYMMLLFTGIEAGSAGGGSLFGSVVR